MLYFLFQLGDERYALAVNRVRRVLPRMLTRPLAQAPAAVVGLATFAGRPLVLLDLCQRVLGRPCRDRMSSRVMVVQLSAGRVGLLVEGLTRAVSLSEEQFFSSGVELPEARFLGDVARWEDSWVQRVEPEELIGPELRSLLAAAG